MTVSSFCNLLDGSTRNHLLFDKMRCYIVLCLVLTITLAVMADSQEALKRFGNGFHMGFGKRAPRYDFKGFHMGFKRAIDNYANIAQKFGGLHMGFKRFSIDPTDSEEYDKRYDGNHFHMGFGKRTPGNNPFLNNNFHMGFGKRSDTDDY